MTGKVWRNLSNPVGQAFWTPSARANEVHAWPAWKRAGINTEDRRVRMIAPNDDRERFAVSGVIECD